MNWLIGHKSHLSAENKIVRLQTYLYCYTDIDIFKIFYKLHIKFSSMNGENKMFVL